MSVKSDRALDRLHELAAAALESNTDDCSAAAGVGREEVLGLLETQLRSVVPAITQPILAELAAVQALLVSSKRYVCQPLQDLGGCLGEVFWMMGGL